MAELLQRPAGSQEIGEYLYDRNGNRLGLLSEFEADYTQVGSPSNDWTYGDVKAQNARNAKELGFQAGAGALASLAQIGIGAIPTATSTRNEERLTELQQAEAAGRLGLSADERAQLEATLLTPARQMARQAEEETGKRLAAMPTASLATQQALQQANQKAAQQAAVQAGIEMGRANIEAKREQTAELESRLKDKAKQEARNIDTAIGAIGDIAKMGGRLAAAQTQVRDLSDKDIGYLTTAKTAEGKPLYEWAYGKDAATVRDAANRQKAFDVMSAQKSAREMERKAKKQPAIGLPETDTEVLDMYETGSY